MTFDEYDDSLINNSNWKTIARNKKCQEMITELRKIEKFLSNFGFLSFGRDFIFCNKYTFSLQIVSNACELTAGSIISCCEKGCMADAFSLLRKFRDDMFFYLYIVVYDTYSKVDDKTHIAVKMGTNIERWINNDLCDLPITTIFKEIGQSPQVKEAVRKYDMKSYFDSIGNRLNNYVHSNGVVFYNRNVNAYQDNELQKQMQVLLKDMQFITTTFLFILTLCSPLSIMSTDYVDFLDYNEIPPEDSQYWVAPFISEFFKNNLEQIDESCMQYLRDNTYMKFD